MDEARLIQNDVAYYALNRKNLHIHIDANLRAIGGSRKHWHAMAKKRTQDWSDDQDSDEMESSEEEVSLCFVHACT